MSRSLSTVEVPREGPRLAIQQTQSGVGFSVYDLLGGSLDLVRLLRKVTWVIHVVQVSADSRQIEDHPLRRQLHIYIYTYLTVALHGGLSGNPVCQFSA